MNELRNIYTDYFFIGLILVFGFLVFGRLAWMYQHESTIQITENFKSVARDRIEVIKDALDTNNEILNSMAAFYHASESVSAEEFDVFVNQILKDHPSIQAVDWIPEVRMLSAHAMNGKRRKEARNSHLFKNPAKT